MLRKEEKVVVDWVRLLEPNTHSEVTAEARPFPIERLADITMFNRIAMDGVKAK